MIRFENRSVSWRDGTIYTFAGPVEDGFPHRITISIDQEVAVDSLDTFVDLHVRALEQEIKGMRVLGRRNAKLDNGLPAEQVTIVWYPTEEARIYQEHLYVLHGGRGYRLAASFTKKTRRALGAQVERMMLGFAPVDA